MSTERPPTLYARQVTPCWSPSCFQIDPPACSTVFHALSRHSFSALEATPSSIFLYSCAVQRSHECFESLQRIHSGVFLASDVLLLFRSVELHQTEIISAVGIQVLA